MPKRRAPLIVEFPLKSRVNCVHFSEMSSLIIFDEDEANSKLFYTSDDQTLFKREASRQANLIAMELSAQPGSIAQDLDLESLGIEKIVFHDMARRIKVHRRKHIRKIVAIQTECTSRELRLVSEESSRSSRNLALELAASLSRQESRSM